METLEKFKDYMFYLLHKPLKILNQNSDIFKVFKVIGDEYDKLGNIIGKVKNQSNIISATDEYLDNLGDDKNVYRFLNESDESYKKRIMAKVDMCKMAGTKKGLEKAIDTLGYNAIIEPLYLTDKERWAEFLVSVEQDLMSESFINMSNIKDVVMEYKQASAKPNYVTRYPITILLEPKNHYNLIFSFYLNMLNNNISRNYYDGFKSYNGKEVYTGGQHSEEKTISSLENIEIKIRFKNTISQTVYIQISTDYSYNGRYTYNGEKIYKAGTILEELK